jgi:raffinose/stachyose/melibiose transport system substrate-binding protein
MNTKTGFTMLAIAFILLAPLTVGATGAQEGAAAASKTVTIQWWNIGTAAADAELNKQFMEEFERAHPNVKIEATVLENEAFKSKLTTVMQSGNPPDLFHSWGGGVLAEYAKAGLLKDISSWVKGTEWGNSMSFGAP